jgi:hypothetical protein
MKTTALIGLVVIFSSLINGFGPPVPSVEVRAITPFEELLKRPVKLRPELNGKHPRVFFSKESLKALRYRAKSSDRDLWQDAVKNVRALTIEPPAPGHPMLNRSGVEQIEGDLSQYDVAYILAEVTFAYAIEQDPRYLEAARKWLLTVIKYEPWGYTFRTPNVDLPPAHLLYAVGFAYDVLFDQLKEEERVSVQKKLALQARLMFDYFKYKPRKRYSYSQNHTFIPMAGLSVAALALMGEDPEAEEWARLARAIFDRTLETFGTDGYYYEGFHYNVFAIHWIIRYLDALEHATGEDLYPRIRDRFQPLKFYVAHSVLPDGRNVFDFGDTGQGATDRNNQQPAKLNAATGWQQSIEMLKHKELPRGYTVNLKPLPGKGCGPFMLTIPTCGLRRCVRCRHSITFLTMTLLSGEATGNEMQLPLRSAVVHLKGITSHSCHP